MAESSSKGYSLPDYRNHDANVVDKSLSLRQCHDIERALHRDTDKRSAHDKESEQPVVDNLKEYIRMEEQNHEQKQRQQGQYPQPYPDETLHQIRYRHQQHCELGNETGELINYQPNHQQLQNHQLSNSQLQRSATHNELSSICPELGSTGLNHHMSTEAFYVTRSFTNWATSNGDLSDDKGTNTDNNSCINGDKGRETITIPDELYHNAKSVNNYMDNASDINPVPMQSNMNKNVRLPCVGLAHGKYLSMSHLQPQPLEISSSMPLCNPQNISQCQRMNGTLNHLDSTTSERLYVSGKSELDKTKMELKCGYRKNNPNGDIAFKCTSKTGRSQAITSQSRNLISQRRIYKKDSVHGRVPERVSRSFQAVHPCLQDVQTVKSNDLLHICSVCKKSFKRLPDMRRHVRVVHHKNKPFKCRECFKQFGEKSNMMKHLSFVHGVHRQFRCNMCNLCFSERSDCDLHITDMHKGTRPKFYCEECGLPSHQKADLLMHYERMHPELLEAFKSYKAGISAAEDIICEDVSERGDGEGKDTVAGTQLREADHHDEHIELTQLQQDSNNQLENIGADFNLDLALGVRVHRDNETLIDRRQISKSNEEERNEIEYFQLRNILGDLEE